MKRQKYCHLIALVSFLLSNIYFQNYSMAASGSVNAELQGSVTISGSGSWASGINLSGTASPNQTSMAGWSGDSGNDYITFIDSAQLIGSHLKIYASSEKFSYEGGGKGNTGLVRGDNIYFETSGSPTRGKDNSTKNINLIGNESCGVANTGNFQLNTDFYSAGKNNSLKLGIGPVGSKVLLRSTAACTTTIRIFLNSIKLYFPALTTSGNYTNSFILLAVDGTP